MSVPAPEMSFSCFKLLSAAGKNSDPSKVALGTSTQVRHSHLRCLTGPKERGSPPRRTLSPLVLLATVRLGCEPDFFPPSLFLQSVQSHARPSSTTWFHCPRYHALATPPRETTHRRHLRNQRTMTSACCKTKCLVPRHEESQPSVVDRAVTCTLLGTNFPRCDSNSGFFSLSMVSAVHTPRWGHFCVSPLPQYENEILVPVTISTESSPAATPTETISEQGRQLFLKPISSAIRLLTVSTQNPAFVPLMSLSFVGHLTTAPMRIRCTARACVSHIGPVDAFHHLVLLNKLRVSGFVVNLPEKQIGVARATIRSYTADVRASQRLPSRRLQYTRRPSTPAKAGHALSTPRKPPRMSSPTACTPKLKKQGLQCKILYLRQRTLDLNSLISASIPLIFAH